MTNETLREQIGVYVRKYWRIFCGNKGWIKILMAGAIAFLVVSVTGEDMFTAYSPTRNGSFVLVCACIWTGLFNSIQTICSERKIIKQEHSSGIYYSSFLLAHTITDFLICLIETLCITAVVVARYETMMQRSGVIDVVPILKLFVTFLLIVYASDILGLMVSAIVTSERWAMTVMPFVLIIQFIISGFIFELNGIFNVISQFTIAKWGLRAVCIVLDVNRLTTDVSDMQGVSSDFIEVINRYTAQLRYDHIHEYDPSILNLLKVWGVLVLFIVAQTVISALVMKLIDFDKR